MFKFRKKKPSPGKVLSFIGAGNMAQAIIAGILGSGLTAADKIYVSDTDSQKLMKMTDTYGIWATGNNVKVADKANVLFLCVKPQNMEAVAEELQPYLEPEVLVVSIAAGISIKKLKELFPFSTDIIRIMPNLAIEAREGMVMIAEESPARESSLAFIEKLFAPFAKTIRLKEENINTFTAVSGSSPAMIFLLLEAMADSAASMGIDRNEAYGICAQAIKGSAEMYLKSKVNPESLRARVTSPGGTTLAMIESLENAQFRDTIDKAMKACVKRAEELTEDND